MAWDRWNSANEPVRRLMAPLATSAAITIGAWDRAEKYVESLPENDHEGGFYRAIIDLHKGNYADALTKVAKSRVMLAANLSPLSSEGYARAYPVNISVLSNDSKFTTMLGFVLGSSFSNVQPLSICFYQSIVLRVF